MLNNCTRSAVMSLPEMKDKYDEEYALYKTDTDSVKLLKLAAPDIGIIIVMGVWCGDSKLQVPRFYKIMDDLTIPERRITLICVDEMKKAAPGLIEDLEIKKVPTFIIIDDNSEIGRIVESPSATLEKDMVEIILTKK